MRARILAVLTVILLCLVFEGAPRRSEASYWNGFIYVTPPGALRFYGLAAQQQDGSFKGNLIDRGGCMHGITLTPIAPSMQAEIPSADTCRDKPGYTMTAQIAVMAMTQTAATGLFVTTSDNPAALGGASGVFEMTLDADGWHFTFTGIRPAGKQPLF